FMMYTEGGTVEYFIIQELQKLGWTYVDPKPIRMKREEDYEEPLIVEDFKKALRRINRDVGLTDADLDFIIVSLRTIPANVEGISRFLDILRNGLVVPLQIEGEERVIRLLDFEDLENNEFIVTNQYRVEGLKGAIRADIVLLVNGIPLVLIECKNPTREEVDWTDAYRQVKRYERLVPDLFKYVQFSIVTDGIKTFYFPNAYNEEGKDFLGVWRDPYPYNRSEFDDDILKITVYGLLSENNLLDLIENFIFVRKEKSRLTKIMARYMQFRASNKIFHRVVDTLSGRDNKRFGLIWHWQGSGKTYTMAFSAWKLYHCRVAENPSIFIVVDRRELEEQIEKDFSFLGVPIERIGSIRELVEVLRWGGGGKRGIFLVTIEKFSPSQFEKLEESGIEIGRRNVIVLADEVHRTHYGVFSTLMRSVFRNAFIFGFTGTPLSKRERNTFQKFCPRGEFYLDRYSMIDALNDGFTVPLRYQARLPEYQLNRQMLNEFLRFEEFEIKSLSVEEQRELRKRVRVIRAFAKKRERVLAIAEDIARHFREIVEPTGLKGMVVAIDREACVLYKRALDKFLPSDYSEIVMTFSPNDKDVIRSYFEELYERYGVRDLKSLHKRITDDFKMKDKPKILIVTDMLLTGFDAPVLWVMYLDKPLREHRILQAIARTNRPYSNKRFGLIVDYIGVLADLERAFEKFEARDVKALKTVIRDLSEEFKKFKSLLEEALGIFEGVSREDTRESLNAALDVLVDPEVAKRFETLVKRLMKSYEMLAGEPFLRDYISDYRWLVKVYIAYNKKFNKVSVDELKIEALSKKTVRLIQRTIDVGEIDTSYPIVSIDEKYINYIRRSLPRDVGAAIDVISNIMLEVERHPRSPFFASLKGEIERTYEELRFRKEVTEEVIMKILDISERIAKWKREEKRIGRDKYPIY
ncbi:MAG TPA: HsdR family type I site-specific deoxyribonuclease, partial [Candidatus Aenigmarchaeota archaeon]|nr:HsdR family type I site-specific deoxyribonuclease [Candidatus Aenigmarchaeota archaeon]